jgi:drug/metabolite transporter (DMT)-like permease
VLTSDWRGIALLGVVWFAFPLSMFPYAEQRVSSAVTGMLNGANPLGTAIVASLIARKLPLRGVVTGLAIGLAGVVLVAWPSLGEGTNSAVGVLLIVLGVSSYGVAVNVARPLQDRNGALPVIWRAQAVGLVLTAPLGLREALDAHWTLVPLLSVLALGALGTGVAYVALSVAGARMGPTRASATTFLIPGVALALGVLVRGEHVATLSVIGCVVCVAGAWWMRQSVAARAAAPAVAGGAR